MTVAGKKALGGVVSVYGMGVSKPLLVSRDARLIQVRDADGELSAMLFRLTGVLWGLSVRGDSDWEDHKGRLEIDDTPFVDAVKDKERDGSDRREKD